MGFGGGFGGGGGGGFGGAGGRVGGGMFGGGPGGGGRLRSALDAADNDDILGKAYDAKIIKRLPKYFAWVKWSILKAASGTVMRTVANMAMPYIIGITTERYIKAKDLHGLNYIVLVYIGFALLMWVGQYVESLFLAYSGQGIIYRMRTQMVDHLLELSMSFFDHNKTGKVMSRVQNDVDQLQTLLTQDVVNIAADAVTLIGIMIVMLTMDAKLALITLSVVPVLVLALFFWRRRARIAFVRARQAIALVNDNLQETISGVRVVQGMSREKVNSEQFDAVNKTNLDANVGAVKLQAFMMPVVQILTDTGFCLVLLFGGFQALAGQTNVGVLIAFLLYIQRFFAPVQDLTSMYTDLQRAMASGSRIFELIDVEAEVKDSPDAIDLPPVKGEVKFQNVSFGYEASAEVLHDVSFTINPGETVAIVGRTGAGKSSVANLITRFYEEQKGEVLIDGHNVNSVTQKSLRQQVSIVPQDAFLFSGTVEENIRFGRLEATREEVIQAAKTAGVHEALMDLSQGYDTPVGERGTSLSGGQRQFVCLARTILACPAILILDEATSSVDTNSERIIQASLHRVSQGRTCILIAHRLSTVVEADRILVFQNGKILETGNHTELMAKQGLYYQLFQTLSAPGLEQQPARTD